MSKLLPKYIYFTFLSLEDHLFDEHQKFEELEVRAGKDKGRRITDNWSK